MAKKTSEKITASIEAFQKHSLRSKMRTARQRPLTDDIRKRAFIADEVLRLRDEDHALKQAFEKFSLDPDEPTHWRFLLDELVNAHFGGRQRSEGRPVGTGKWNDEKIGLLAEHMIEVYDYCAHKGWRKPSNAVTRELIKLNHTKHYQHDPDDRVEREIGAFLRRIKPSGN